MTLEHVLRQEQLGDGLQPVAYVSRSLTPAEQQYAQIEKEAFAVTWACECLSDYLLGLHFHIETDHKPLVSLLCQKLLDELPVRIQRFRLRMMRFSFSISHIPGKELIIADALSWAPAGSAKSDDYLLEKEAEAYNVQVMITTAASEEKLEEIRQAQDQDEICKQLMFYIQHGWPEKQQLFGVIKKFYSVAPELNVQNGLLVRGSRLVIPASMHHKNALFI